MISISWAISFICTSVNAVPFSVYYAWNCTQIGDKLFSPNKYLNCPFSVSPAHTFDSQLNSFSKMSKKKNISKNIHKTLF